MRALVLCLTVLFVLPAAAQDSPHRLTVTGTGSVAEAPDMAVITLGATADADEAADAMAEASDIAAALLDTLAASGIAAADIQTGELNLTPLHGRDNASTPERISGFRATNVITARVRDLPSLGTVLDELFAEGANTFRSLQFALQDPAPAEDAARRAAVADALHRARLYAEAAGLTLGPILEFNEAPDNNRPALMRGAAAESLPVAEGEVSTTASVTVVFQITGP